ncbi:MAG: ABC transporter ATP-binding protein [Coriobacteriales bacterium]|jgi:ABC-2 type transport system ATP-binding protein|nr:ABC transporter ATP-binding protein [Coriobacteriales bacterium]
MRELARAGGLAVRYGQTLAVDGLSFAVNEGEVLAVIGPNGSGKTSAVECLEGLRQPTRGTVHVFGLDPHAERRAIYSQLGVQLQDVSYPDKIRVGELCRLFASFYRQPADWRALLEQLDLGDKARRPVDRLSGGERQRLSVLLALLPRPRMLILDELTTGLDPEVRRSLWHSLKELRTAGLGILLVSHSMDEVEALADRVLFMLAGKALYYGELPGLRTYAQAVLPPHEYDPRMSLEDLYLSLVPKRGALTMEVTR